MESTTTTTRATTEFDTCDCGHGRYMHGEDDFSAQECTEAGCECDNFVQYAQPDASPTEAQATAGDAERQLHPLWLGVRGRYLIEHSGLYIAEFLRPEYAPDIVRAVNRDHAFDALVEAAKEALESITDGETVEPHGYLGAIGKLRAALRLAGEQGGK